MQSMVVVVPDGVMPGQEFVVNTPAGQMKVVCPMDAGPGQQMQVNIPAAAPVVVQAQAVPMAETEVIRLEKLKTMLEKGFVTQEEHDAKKAEILAKM